MAIKKTETKQVSVAVAIYGTSLALHDKLQVANAIADVYELDDNARFEFVNKAQKG